LKIYRRMYRSIPPSRDVSAGWRGKSGLPHFSPQIVGRSEKMQLVTTRRPAIMGFL